jgi:hypothetical protein
LVNIYAIGELEHPNSAYSIPEKLKHAQSQPQFVFRGVNGNLLEHLDGVLEVIKDILKN